MITTNEYRDLPEFLSKHNITKKEKNENTEFTHTRIGDPSKRLNIFPASYCIPNDKKKIFYNLYYGHIFVKKKMEYLTERQLENIGPILIDFDFRYNYDVETRQHTPEHIQDIINILYLEELKEFFIFEENKPFSIYVMEKPHINRVQEDNVTKDGIHFYFGIQMDHIMQQMLRERILLKIADYIDLPITNDWDKVLDEGISKGKTNWTLYGSRKPNHEAYELTQHFEIKYDKRDCEFMMIEKSIKDFNFEKDFMKLTAQYEDNVKFEINPKIIDEYNKRKSGGKTTKIKKPSSKTRVVLLEDEENEEYISIEDITNEEILKKAIDNIMNSLTPEEYDIKEAHEYTQILPEKYYEPGSHLLNRQVAFALKNTDKKKDRLFLSWIMLRSKASDFSYDSIPDLYMKWKKHFNKTNRDNSESLTNRSIMYWAKQDAYDEYKKVKENTVDYYVEQTLNSAFTEWDIATVLYHLFKDKYLCTSIKKKEWYVFKDHRWILDDAISLRSAISRELFDVYSKKQDQLMVEKNHYGENDERQEFINKSKVAEIQEYKDVFKTFIESRFIDHPNISEIIPPPISTLTPEEIKRLIEENHPEIIKDFKEEYPAESPHNFVIKIVNKNEKGEITYYCNLVVSYTINNVNYSNKIIVDSSKNYNINDVLKIKYNESNPNEIIEDNPLTNASSNPITAYGLCICALCMCIILYAYTWFVFTNKNFAAATGAISAVDTMVY
jgi:hypothetical protein